MAKLKKKVQAQRKFAQGAYVPPTPSVPIERRIDSTPGMPQEQRNVFHNNMSASNLLDVVSFQKLHNHLQLIVLLERLQPEPMKPTKSIIKSNGDVPNGDVPNGDVPAVSAEKETVKLTGKPKTVRHRDATYSMRLRSRSGPVKNKRVLSSVNKRKFAKQSGTRRQLSTDTGFSIDDNRPLKFFTKKSVKRHSQKLEKSIVKRSVTERRPPPDGPRRSHEFDDFAIPGPSAGRSRKRSAEDPPVTKLTKVTTPLRDSTRDAPKKYNKFRAGGRFQPQSGGGCYREEDIHRWLDDSTETPSQSSCDSENAFKVPETPPRSNEYKVPDGLNESNDVTPCRARSPVPLPLSTPRVHSPPPPPRISQCPPSPCPSERYTTVEEVISAPQCDLDRRCKGCRACRRVAKVHVLNRLIQDPEQPRAANGNDVYEFNPECDDAVDHATMPKLRQTRSQEPVAANPSNTKRPVHVNNSSDLNENVSEDLYLDLLPGESTHVVQITETTVQGRKILHASLVEKSDVYPNGSLIEHKDLQETAGLEGLLEKIFQKLGVSFNRLFSNEARARAGVALVDNKGIACEKRNSIPNKRCQLPATNQVTNIKEGSPTVAGVSTQEAAQPVASAGSSIRAKTGLTRKKSADGNVTNNFPKRMDTALLVDAPVYSPTEEEFQDPISYFEKIMPVSAKFGMCKIVVPKRFKPPCHVTDRMPIRVCNQYIARMYSRWGPAAREMTAIKAYLASQGVPFTRAPLMDGVEVNLPKLYHLVQRHGGLKKVIEKKRWGRIAEEMRLTGKSPEKAIDKIYVKHLLPYDTLSHQERQEIICKVEKHWNKRHQGMLERAANPLHRQKRLLEESESSADDSDEEIKVSEAFCEAEECVLKGRNVSLILMKRVGQIQMQAYFPNTPQPTPEEVEKEYWRIVLLGTEHVCVNSASVDTGEEGYGFPKDVEEKYGNHPWNLKRLRENSGNILGSLGPVLGVTVPTLHLGMVFSTSCWHRDPHGLPWMEYMHSGPPKIWYGIPDDQSENFRKAVETLCPTACQNKSIWLPSDIAMIPPNLLREHNVSLSRVEQRAGEFIIVFPKAYSSSICTGYTVSESVYFGTNFWLQSVNQVHQELRESCEPTMFSIEKLLVAVARDSRPTIAVLQQVYSSLSPLLRDELEHRRSLHAHGVRFLTAESFARNRKNKKLPAGAWNLREQDECEICRTTLYLSKVTGLTGRSSSVCVQHALRLLEKSRHRNRPIAALQAITFMTVKEIERSLNQLEKRVTE